MGRTAGFQPEPGFTADSVCGIGGSNRLFSFSVCQESRKSDILDQVWGGQPAANSSLVSLPILPAESREVTDFSPFQFAKKVEKVLEEFIRPSLRMDGGDVEIMDIKGTIIYCGLKGACSGCAGASQTLKMMVERILKDQVDERIRVIEV